MKAIAIHSPAPNAAQALKYVVTKYGVESANEDSNKQLIELAKLLNLYAIKYRKFVADKICQKLGVTAVETYDSPHMFVDNDNTFRFECQRSNVGDTPIVVDEKTGNVYIFEGLSNSQYMNSFPGAPYFLTLEKQGDINQFINDISESAKLLKVVSIKQNDCRDLGEDVK